MSRLLPSRFILPASRRCFTESCRRPAFSTGPAPPRLPPKEQEEFERLQKSSTGAFSTPKSHLPSSTESPAAATTARVRPQVNQSPDSTAEERGSLEAKFEAKGQGEELHPDIKRGAKPEFEGDRNPKTGEVGGPKNEPLRWGSTGERGDWSYNGRVTDF